MPFYGTLSQSGRNILMQNLMPYSCERGQILHEAGDDSYGMIYVEEGSLCVSLQRGVTLFRLHKGDVCFLTASETISELTFDVTVEAETDAKIQSLPDECLTQLMKRNPAFLQYVYQSVAENFSSTVKLFQSILFDSFDRRLAMFLYEETVTARSSVLSVTHEQIAHHIGSAREVVTRALKRFSDEGIVSLGRGSLTVTDKTKLQKLIK